MDLSAWFDTLWNDYAQIAPKVSSIKGRIEARGENVVNDHIAFRTYDLAPIGIAKLGPIVESLGYSALEDYEFPEKKVQATAYVKAGAPRIFLSELRTAEFAPRFRDLFASLAEQAAHERIEGPEVFTRGIVWEPLAYQTYLELREVSEYGAWVAALGLRPNHFTVNVNALQSFDDLSALLDFVEAEGFALNTAGGRIKGSAAVFLEQGSTMADQIEVAFADRRAAIPTCYYEFAERHATADGSLYDGFVASSADRIFESTNSKSSS